MSIPAAETLKSAKDCVKEFLTGLGYQIDITKIPIIQQSSIISNQNIILKDSNQSKWESKGSPFTYRMNDGNIGMYWDPAKFNSYTVTDNDRGEVLEYRTLINTNSKLTENQKQAAIAKINDWNYRLGQTTSGATFFTFLAIGRSLGSVSLDQSFLSNHELGHGMAMSQNSGTHPDFWINEDGQTRLDSVQSGEATPDTVGVILTADSKAASEGTTVEQALRSMGMSGLADIISTKFAGKGGC